MINSKIIGSIKEKKMDRKDFLKYSCLALVAAVGLKSVFAFLTQPDAQDLKAIESNKTDTRGYGGGRRGV